MVIKNIKYKKGLFGSLFFSIIALVMGQTLFWILMFVLFGFVVGVAFDDSVE